MVRFRISNLAGRPALATVLRYGFAFASVAAALGLSLIMVRYGLPRLFGIFSFAAIAIAFWYAGTGPGLLTVLLSSLAFSFYLFPIKEVRGAGWEYFLAIYAMFGGLVGWFSTSRRRAERLLAEARDSLEKRVAERTRELARANEELKSTENALRQSEDHLRLVIDTVPALIHTGRPDGYLDYFNRRWLDYVGLPLGEVAGWKWTATIHPEDVATILDKWHAALATGEPFEDEARVRRADGEYRWMLHRKVPLRDERGNIVKWYGSSVDIEDRKRAEDGLRAATYERTRLSAVRAEIGMALARKGSLREVLQACAEALVQQLDAAFARIWTLSSDGGELELQASAGMYTRLNGRYSRIPLGEIKVGHIGQERKAHLTNDVQNDPQIDDKDWARAEKITSFAGYPLVVEDRIVGVMGMFSKKPVNESTLDTLSILADGIAQGIERKRAEDDLRRQKEVLQKIIDNAPVMIRALGPDGTTKLVNREWERTMGWTLEEILGQDLDVFAELYPDPEYRQEVMKFVLDAKSGFADFRTRVRDGRVIDTSWASVRLSDGTTIGIGRDITERKRAEQALRESEEQHRSVVQTASDAVISVDKNGQIIFANQATTQVFGYTPAELIGMPLTILMPEFMRGSHTKGFGRYVKTGERTIDWRRMEFVGLRKNGNQFPVEISFGEFAHNGQQTFTGFLRDTTDRKRAEDALRRSEAFLAEGQRLAHTGSWAYNPSGFFEHWSQELFRIFGFDPAKGAPTLAQYLGAVHTQDREFMAGTIEKMVAQGIGCDVKKRILRPDGELRYIRCVGTPVFEKGILKSIVGTAMDVTEQELLTGELERSSRQLRALAARLQSIREEERSRVAREIHDELGQALTAMKIDLASLLRATPTDKAVEIQRGESILNLLHEAIQSVRRIATELRPVVLDELGLVAAVEWASEEFQARTGIHCRLDLPQDDVDIDPGCATALFRILQETLTNVARHANATEVNVRLAQEGGNLALEVHDNGIGISEEQLSAANSLGILGMRERALLLGGEFTISGAGGKGTTVIARLPQTHCAPTQERS
jgi:PAS domain S-box-containing protein